MLQKLESDHIFNFSGRIHLCLQTLPTKRKLSKLFSNCRAA